MRCPRDCPGGLRQLILVNRQGRNLRGQQPAQLMNVFQSQAPARKPPTPTKFVRNELCLTSRDPLYGPQTWVPAQGWDGAYSLPFLPPGLGGAVDFVRLVGQDDIPVVHQATPPLQRGPLAAAAHPVGPCDLQGAGWAQGSRIWGP